jgi:hypothetical protein
MHGTATCACGVPWGVPQVAARLEEKLHAALDSALERLRADAVEAAQRAVAEAAAGRPHQAQPGGGEGPGQ